MDAKLDLGYSVTETSEGTQVKFNGDGLGFWAIASYSVLSAFALLFWGIGVIMFGMLFVGLWRRKKVQSFVIGKDALVSNGLRYKYSDISEISLDLPDGNVYTNTSMARTTGLRDIASTGAAQRSFSISLRHGRKVVPIAKFLTEDKAIAIYSFLSSRANV